MFRKKKHSKPNYRNYSVSQLEDLIKESNDAATTDELFEALIFQHKQSLLQLTDKKALAKQSKKKSKGLLSRLRNKL